MCKAHIIRNNGKKSKFLRNKEQTEVQECQPSFCPEPFILLFATNKHED
jgi:hypothetical protein